MGHSEIIVVTKENKKAVNRMLEKIQPEHIKGISLEGEFQDILFIEFTDETRTGLAFKQRER